MKASFLLATSLLSISVALSANSLQAASISYELGFSDAANHYLDVKMTIDDVRQDELTVMMAVWTPGSYLMREYARNIDGIKASAADGRSLKLTKQNRNRWRLECSGQSTVTVTYRLYCHEMSVRTNWVDSDLAILNGAATFLTVPERRNQEHLVSVALPKYWKRGVCSLEEVQPGRKWKALTFEELVDNPLLVGNPVIEDFVAGGKPHQLVCVGDTSLWKLKKAASDVQKIVEEHQRMYKDAPYDDYKFLNAVTEGRGGLEHDRCTLLMTSRWNFIDEERYKDWLSLVSHEFFHTWNVRRLRPAGIWQYDLEKENYTPSLWIAEGITSYYEDVALVRAGLIDRDAYLKRLSKGIKSLQTTNGRKVQSLTASSHDTWIKFYRPDENSKNSRVSYYTKGAVVAFLLDAKIRLATDNSKSLDDLMRTMHSRFSGKRGYTEPDFRTTASEIAGQDLTEWFAAAIDGTQELNYAPALSCYGLMFSGNDKDNKEGDADEQKKGKETEKPDDDEPRIDVGVTFSSSSTNATVSGIRSESSAFEAGLNVGDEVIAINGYRTSPGKWDSQLKAFSKANPAKKSVVITISRRGKLRELPLQLDEASDDTWKLKVAGKPSQQQQDFLKSWLHLPDTKEAKKDSSGTE